MDEEFLCPYCGEPNPLVVDITGGSNQSLVIDCEVCCAPILIRVRVQAGEITSVDVRKENE
jgi:hypothetical protein